MKKLKLSGLNLSSTEILTRKQLKKILGGSDGSGGDGKCSGQCGGGDSSPWTADCAVKSGFCLCPNVGSSWSNCKSS